MPPVQARHKCIELGQGVASGSRGYSERVGPCVAGVAIDHDRTRNGGIPELVGDLSCGFVPSEAGDASGGRDLRGYLGDPVGQRGGPPNRTISSGRAASSHLVTAGGRSCRPVTSNGTPACAAAAPPVMASAQSSDLAKSTRVGRWSSTTMSAAAMPVSTRDGPASRITQSAKASRSRETADHPRRAFGRARFVSRGQARSRSPPDRPTSRSSCVTGLTKTGAICRWNPNGRRSGVLRPPRSLLEALVTQENRLQADHTGTPTRLD